MYAYQLSAFLTASIHYTGIVNQQGIVDRHYRNQNTLFILYLDFNHKHVSFIKISHNILIQCHGNGMEMNKFNYKLEIDILRNSSQKNLGVLRGAFLRVWVSKRHPDALLAKTMVHPLGTYYKPERDCVPTLQKPDHTHP